MCCNMLLDIPCVQAQQALMEVSWPEGLMGGDEKSSMGPKTASRRRLKCESHVIMLCLLLSLLSYIAGGVHMYWVKTHTVQYCFFAGQAAEHIRQLRYPCDKVAVSFGRMLSAMYIVILFVYHLALLATVTN